MNKSPHSDITRIINARNTYGVSEILDTLLHPAFSVFVRTIIIELIEHPKYTDDEFLTYIIKHRENYALTDEQIQTYYIDPSFKNDLLNSHSVIRTLLSKLLKFYPSPDEYIKTKSYLFNTWVYENKFSVFTVSKLKTFSKIYHFDVDREIVDLIAKSLGDDSSPYNLTHSLNETIMLILSCGNMNSELLTYTLNVFNECGNMVDNHDFVSLRNRCYDNGYIEEFENFHNRLKLCNRIKTE